MPLLRRHHEDRQLYRAGLINGVDVANVAADGPRGHRDLRAPWPTVEGDGVPQLLRVADQTEPCQNCFERSVAASDRTLALVATRPIQSAGYALTQTQTALAVRGLLVEQFPGLG